MPAQITPKKTPERKCVGCGEKKSKKELIRVVRTPDGSIVIDRTGKISGRGAYICPSSSCFKKAVKARRFESGLSVSIPTEVFDALLRELGENE